MSKKSKPGDGVQHQGVKGGGLYETQLTHVARTSAAVRRLRAISAVARGGSR